MWVCVGQVCSRTGQEATRGLLILPGRHGPVSVGGGCCPVGAEWTLSHPWLLPSQDPAE